MTAPPASRLPPRVGVLGGTLDPIHCGHIAAAVAARDALDLTSVLVIPSRVPPHRSIQPQASAYHRFAMAALGVSGEPRLDVSDDELMAEGPSYTADTLERLHARGLAASQIFFIIGADAFAEIATWKRYPEVLDLAHFVVVSRPGHRIEALQARLPALAARMRLAGEDGADVRSPVDPTAAGAYARRIVDDRARAAGTGRGDHRARAPARRGAHPQTSFIPGR